MFIGERIQEHEGWSFVISGVTHEDREFSHHLGVGPFSSNFIFPSVPRPFFSADEDLGRSRELVYVFKDNIVKFPCVIFQDKDNGAYTLWIDEPLYAID